ncbi:helix-turn-helix domain-containing protein, partial [Ruegeria sp. HKCCA4008]|uniref:helix-turn-helix domain-containing protein n=1 Tax=Ruegeria sp. HKCCA4008 TaxID=2682999 RepID=UPI001C2CBA65
VVLRFLNITVDQFSGGGSTQITVRPRATDIIGAVAYTGMSRATLYAEMKTGALKFVKIGGATRLEYNELDRWFDEKSKEVAA